MRKTLKTLRVALTIGMAALAVLAGTALWRSYVDSPWTRDGRVRSRIVQLTPDVSGVVTELRIHDNQTVSKGDVLFVIDPSRYRLAVEQAKATVEGEQIDVDQRRKEAARRDRLSQAAITVESQEQARTALASAEAALRQAEVALDLAALNLSRTEVRSPVNGTVTSLLLDEGDYATSGKATMALVDSDGFFVAGYFEESKLRAIHIGDPVAIRLMSDDRALTGTVESVARAIVDRDNAQSADLIANVDPSFAWVRLAQRVPVRIKLEAVPEGVALTSGMTATVVVRPGEGVRFWW